MQEDILETVHYLEKDIKKKENQIDFIKSIDWSKPITEKDFHKLCLTPLRTSDTMEVLIQNTFPEAKNIVNKSNYVYFNLYDFKCRIPTYRENAIEIDVSYYTPHAALASYNLSSNLLRMKRYLKAKNNHASWLTLFNYRLPSYEFYSKLVKFILWFGYYKWKDDHQEYWENEIKEQEEQERKFISHRLEAK